ncbi:MAG: 23S rRNA (adenine(2503)-C(2))-methyltransferase RlmN [Candidatus Paceibacterota bacterium]
MDFELLEKLLEEEPKYRLNQAKKAVFCDLIEDWHEVKALPKKLMEKLSENFSLEIKSEIFKAANGKTAKALLTLSDGLQTETVLMEHEKDRNTVCVSSAVGCPMGCKFCATGKMGFKRNLTKGEILTQLLVFARYLKSQGKKISNVVFMGMGEPFINYDNVLSAIKIINDKNGFGIGARKISISTSGVIEGINKLAEEKLQINLAISLHAPNNQLRSEIMPINNRYPLEKVLEAVDSYINKTSRKVMFEYLLLKDVNDSEIYAEQLANIMDRPLYMVNLIKYNPTGTFYSSDTKTIQKFKNILESRGVEVTQRYSFGTDINAACGQLATDKA